MVDDYVNVKHGAKQADVPAPGDEGSPGRDPRRDGLPRTGDADLNRLGGIELSQAYACIKAISKKKTEIIAQGREQFVAGAVERRASRRTADQDLRPDRVLRRLRLQQVALDRLRPRRLPDGLPQGPLPDRVHGRPALLRDGRGRARQVLRRAHRRLPADGHRGAAARHQRGAVEFQVADEGKIHFGLGAIKGVGYKAVEAIVAARERGRAVHEPRRLLRARPARRSSARRASRRSSRPARSTCLGARRSQLLAVLPRAAQAGQAAPGRPQARPAEPLRRLRARRNELGTSHGRRRA